MFPERLKTIRIERSFSRSQLAAILGVGRAAVAKWELGIVFRRSSIVWD